MSTTVPAAPALRTSRDPYLDALRGGSLLVVVLWHLFGTRLHWSADGPHATSPLASVPGLWLGTWVLQVMPVFFYVGGYLHPRSWRPGFIRYRLVGLLGMATPLLFAWVVVGGILAAAGGTAWADGTVLFALSPLWFLAVYVVLVALLPLWLYLHRRLGAAALPLLAGLAVVVDIVRLGAGIGWFGWLNLVFVWGLAHQAGFHHDALLRAPRRLGYALVAGGLAVLCGLLALGYPGSMVGVPGAKWSNMSPPTIAIVALTALQVGLIRLGHPKLPALLSRPVARRILALANRYGMPVFLLHMSAFLLFAAVGWPGAVVLAAGAVGALMYRRVPGGHYRPQ
ncbi:MAG: acyltransferase [Micromonosporaceae bacterium]|nr:acyltransferase [Micromonosporaceae bacterium]